MIESRQRSLKILIAPDSFKGSASAVFVAKRLKEILLGLKIPEKTITIIPLADGGEGSLQAIQHVKSLDRIYLNVIGPEYREISAFYLYDHAERMAYIELAQASGLGLIRGKNDIMNASTYGTGQLINDAIEKGAKEIIIFLGGSATCDAGIGIAEALGVNFYNLKGIKIWPSAHNMCEIGSFDNSFSVIKPKNIKISLAVDVNNPFCGFDGASYVYSPQKGANPFQVKQLDDGLKNLAKIIKVQNGIDLQNVKGSGAAGGTAGGLLGFLDAKIISGTELIFRLLEIEKKVMHSDIIISGEGKIDAQTLNNKLLYGLSRLTINYNKKLWAICGFFDGDERLKTELNIDKIFRMASSKSEISDSIKNFELRLEEMAKEIALAIFDISLKK